MKIVHRVGYEYWKKNAQNIIHARLLNIFFGNKYQTARIESGALSKISLWEQEKKEN